MAEVKNNIFEECEVTDWVLASLLSYAGYPLVKCLSDGGNTSTTWVFKGVPEFDLQIYALEATKTDTSVNLIAFIAAQKTIQAAQREAARNCGFWNGRWYSQAGAA